MINLALAILAFSAQESDSLTELDVAKIVSVAVEASLPHTHLLRGGLAQPLHVDVTEANARFEALAKRTLPIMRESWLPARAYEDTPTFKALACPKPNKISSACRMRAAGTLVRVSRVVPGASPEEFTVAVDFVRARSDTDARLTWITAIIEVDKVAGVWHAKVARFAVP